MVGVDEVGRGAWAGPLLVVAAKLTGEIPPGLTDSKLLSQHQRETLLPFLLKNFIFGEGWTSATEIDNYGLSSALRLGAERALRRLGCDPKEQIILDGIVNYLPRRYKNVSCEARADSSVAAVCAASVYAKVRRDKLMGNLTARHEGFRFDEHVGYGTAKHSKELQLRGPLQRVHRFSFQPIKELTLL